MIINQIIITTISRNLNIVETTEKSPCQGRQILFVTLMERGGHKAFECKNRKLSDFCHNMRTYSKGQTDFFALGYIFSDKTNLLVNCGATNHVITNKSKYFKFWPRFWTRNHFVELTDESRANNSAEKR